MSLSAAGIGRPSRSAAADRHHSIASRAVVDPSDAGAPFSSVVQPCRARDLLACAGRRRRRQRLALLDGWLRHLTERTDPFLSWLGVLFALLTAARLGLTTAASTGRLLSAAVWTTWAVSPRTSW
jgi:hypothetical protein